MSDDPELTDTQSRASLYTRISKTSLDRVEDIVEGFVDEAIHKSRSAPTKHLSRRKFATGLRYGFERLRHLYTLGIPYRFEQFQGRHPHGMPIRKLNLHLA